MCCVRRARNNLHNDAQYREEIISYDPNNPLMILKYKARKSDISHLRISKNQEWIRQTIKFYFNPRAAKGPKRQGVGHK